MLNEGFDPGSHPLTDSLLRDAEMIIFAAISSSWRSDVIIVMMFVFSHDESVWPGVVLLCVCERIALVLWDINEMLMLLFCQILINSVSPSRPALVYESVPVSDDSPVLRDMLFSPDLQFIYTLTDKQVSTRFYTLHNDDFTEKTPGPVHFQYGVAMRIWCQNVLNCH